MSIPDKVMKLKDGKIIYDDLRQRVENLNETADEKADKVNNATSGNFAALDGNGNLIDSGHKHSDYLTSFTESDPTVPAWAKAAQKPSYTAQEVGALPANTVIPTVPTNVSSFTNDAGYLTQHQDISGKANSADLATVATSGEYDDLLNKPTIPIIPINVSAFTNDAGYLTTHQDISGKVDKVTGKGLSANDFTDAYKTKLDSALTSYTETDPTVPAWAKAAEKPAYTAAEVGATTSQDVSDMISTAIGNIHQFDIEVVQELPTTNIKDHTVYFVPKTGETNDVYDEYIRVNNGWEMIGNTQIDLSNYATKNEIPTVPTNVSAFTNDAGYGTYTKPSGGIPSTDLADGVIPNVPVQDVQVNGTTILSSGVASIPTASTIGTFGVMKVDGNEGIGLYNGNIYVSKASDAGVKAGSNTYTPIVPSNQHAAAFYGLAKAAGDSTQASSNNAVGTYTDDAKAAIQQMLDVPSNSDMSAYATKTDTVLETTLSRGRKGNTTIGENSFAFGSNVEASETNAFAEGQSTIASGRAAHAEGGGTTAVSMAAHAEGAYSFAKGTGAHAEGVGGRTFNNAAHAEGMYSYAFGEESHAEGWRSSAYGNASHAEGGYVHNGTYFYLTSTNTTNQYQYTQLEDTPAISVKDIVILNNVYRQITDVQDNILTLNAEFSEPCNNTQAVYCSQGALATYSHSEGESTIAKSYAQHVQGMYNVADSNSVYCDIIGNGLSNDTRSNAYALDWNGNGYYAGDIYVNCNADSTGGTKLATLSDIPDLTSYITDTYYAAPGIAGLTQAGNGLAIGGHGTLSINSATAAQIKTGTNNYNPIVPSTQDTAVFYGLAKAAGDTTQAASSNAVGTYTDSAKLSIQTMLDIVSKPSIDNAGINSKSYTTLLGGQFSVTTATTTGYNNPYARASVTGRFNKNNLHRVTFNGTEYILPTRLWYEIESPYQLKVYEYLGNLGLFISDTSGVPGGTDDVPFIIISDLNNNSSIDVLTSTAGTYTIKVEKITNTQILLPKSLIYGNNYAPIEKIDAGGTYNGFSMGVNEINNARGSFAIGYGNKINNEFSWAIGTSNTVGIGYAMGDRNIISYGGNAIGFRNTVSNADSGGVAIGALNQVVGSSIAIGMGVSATDGSIVVGQNNVDIVGYPVWTSNTVYTVGNIIKVTSIPYPLQCKKDHTSSSSFFNDYAENWTILDTSFTSDTVFLVGNGEGSTKSNAMKVTTDGDVRIRGDVYIECNTDSSGGTKLIKTTDYATGSNAGVIKIGEGVALDNNNKLNTVTALDTQVKAGIAIYRPITPSNQHLAVFYGLSRVAGVNLANETVTVGIYPETSQSAIRTMLGAGTYSKPSGGIPSTDLAETYLTDVQVNGSSVVSNKVATVPLADGTHYGLIKVNGALKPGSDVSGGSADTVYIQSVSVSGCKGGTIDAYPLTPSIQHAAAFYGLAKAAGDTTQASSSNEVGTYTNSAKAAIQTMLGVESGVNFIENVSGTTPSITGQPNVRYICGECSTLTIIPPSAGSIIVRFASGTTATVLTVNNVLWPDWFDSTSLEASRIYEIMITDGIYGAVMSWPQ